MSLRTVPASGPINLAILYPTVWFGDEDALAVIDKAVRDRERPLVASIVR